jgi:hypothetical protein
MPKSFSVLYAGHILEGEGIGFGGVPANDRRFTNDQCVRALHISADLAQHMESLGYNILWLAEHHFQREGYAILRTEFRQLCHQSCRSYKAPHRQN